ncbi:hypothetical protein L596_028128 [Steinernema carpocapsae]|uniref:Mediator of RNA polymerase II transcription subunit 20 n=1 Tax=Steinernema carpocapsae TaxID=34508 RepID=A0A4U5LXH5_STECR|nr:hypothetical protein L596_028128 [Steinernema carpocapsae]
MVGVAWVFESKNSPKQIEAVLEQFGAENICYYNVDCVPYNPSEGVQGSLQGCFLLHHSYCPESSFIQCGPIDASKRTAATSDRGFDLILSKLSKGLTPDLPGKFEVTGNEYKLQDFHIRVGSTVMNAVSKGVIVEIEYAATSLPNQACPLIGEAAQEFFREQQIEKPSVFNKQIPEYTMADTMEQYLHVFQDMRKKAT